MHIIDDAGRMNDFKASTSHSGTWPQATLRYKFFTFYLWASHTFYYCLRCHRQQGCDGHHKDFPTTHTILQGVWFVTVRLAFDDAVQSFRGMVFCFIAFWSKIKPAICIFSIAFIFMQVKFKWLEANRTLQDLSQLIVNWNLYLVTVWKWSFGCFLKCFLFSNVLK
jgi:hypothetical protein